MAGFLGLPSPGQVISAIGNAAQNAENFVSSGVNNAISAMENTVENFDPGATSSVTVVGQNGQTGNLNLRDVVTRAEFARFVNQVHAGFDAVRSDVASIRTHGPTGDGTGGLYDSTEDDSSGSSGMDPLMMVLLLNGGLGTGGTGTLDTTTLLLLMGGDSFSDMDPIEMLLVLGKI